jgi:hypothetical protein
LAETLQFPVKYQVKRLVKMSFYYS